MPADDYVPQADEPVGGSAILYSPSTFARHARAVEMVEGDNHALYPRSSRGRTTRPSHGAWGSLASGATISGAAGLMLGEGTVTLCDRSGGSLTTTPESVPVLNSGAAIAGPATLSLLWTDGEWSVCVCGGGGNCSPCSIPERDLILTQVRQVDGVTFTITLVFNSSTMTWSQAGQPEVHFECRRLTSNNYELFTVDNPDDGAGEVYHPEDTTCDPFHVHFTCGLSYFGCPCPPGTAPCYDFYIDE